MEKGKAVTEETNSLHGGGCSSLYPSATKVSVAPVMQLRLPANVKPQEVLQPVKKQ
jgi:hypothetical protein